MVDAIITVFVVLAIFVVVATLLAVYVWRADPCQFAVWRAALLSKDDGWEASAPRTARSARPRMWRLRVSRPLPPIATMPPVPIADTSAAARLEYWVEEGP